MSEPVKGVELRTERLLLRPFRLDDVDEVFEYAKDPEWAQYLGGHIPQPYTRRDAEQFVAHAVLASWDAHPVFAVELNGRVSGGVALDMQQTDAIAELGYALAKPHWGKGLMPEAVRAAVNWGFESLGFAKVYALIDLRHTRSQRVMEKLGMTREGVLRSHANVRGNRIDVATYGLVREDWEQGRRS